MRAQDLTLRGLTAVVVCLGLLALPAVAWAGGLRVYRTPTLHALPENIARGPHGDLWFTEANAGAVVRMTPSGSMTAFPVGREYGPDGIVAGPLGRMWFSGAVGIVGSVTVAGKVQTVCACTATTSRSLAVLGAAQQDLAAGVDGEIYFTAQLTAHPDTFYLDRLSPTTGAVTVFAALSPGRFPKSVISAGKDGLWIDEVGFNPHTTPELLHLGYDGRRRIIRLGRGDLPGGMAMGARNTLWVGDGAYLLRVDTRTGRTQRIPLPLPHFSGLVSADEVAATPRGAVWFIGSDGVLGQRSAKGHFSYRPIPAGVSGGIVADGDRVYMIDQTRSEVVVVNASPADRHRGGGHRRDRRRLSTRP
jgi:streptogramin lyase